MADHVINIGVEVYHLGASALSDNIWDVHWGRTDAGVWQDGEVVGPGHRKRRRITRSEV